VRSRWDTGLMGSSLPVKDLTLAFSVSVAQQLNLNLVAIIEMERLQGIRKQALATSTCVML
jgi:hypothetical protein